MNEFVIKGHIPYRATYIFSRIKIFKDFTDIYPALKIFILKTFCSTLEAFLNGRISLKICPQNFHLKQISGNPQNFISPQKYVTL